ncbi:ceramide-1-phosphate transfer protein-like [Denticeps clupeoides]|uniref:Ceramide-1-phosphate transfer protein n=1 Tax=Denticeps clupeoides TaxID=299321 RepID=A0A8C4CC09_9TELE|nr:ceramide-1-phosphate transfer protein-like [Denticeps clupeoides]XP_028850308.1 ceramide-1-phosphate transfer protein-like [Denticeps clupeoides]
MAEPAAEEQRFSLREVLDTFRSCLSENREVLVADYVAGWRGLVRFLNSLGSVFSFISKDATNKIQILDNFLQSENRVHYASVQSMVQFELENELVDLTKRGKFPESGCRTLLRLHRALRWLELFLERLRTSGEDGKTSAMCSEAYNESLAQHHPWIVRTAAGVAFCALPGRATFFEVMNAGAPDQVVAMLGDALPLISEVYQVVEDVYAHNDLLQLP